MLLLLYLTARRKTTDMKFIEVKKVQLRADTKRNVKKTYSIADRSL